jgi:outer membrane protein OmpA-like peptidoglycan-associated protein
VAKRLVELGVGADMLTSKGYGQDMPVADNNTEEGRAQNRRMDSP